MTKLETGDAAVAWLRPTDTIRWDKGDPIPPPPAPRAGWTWCSWLENGVRFAAWFADGDLERVIEA